MVCPIPQGDHNEFASGVVWIVLLACSLKRGEFCRFNGTVKPRLHDTTGNRFDSRLCRVNKHPTGCQTGCKKTGCITGLTTVLNEQPLFVQPVVKRGCTTGLTTACSV